MKTKVISILTKLTIMGFFTVYLTSCKDTVESVSSVSLDNTTLGLKEGENATLNATVLPAGADNKKITWRSSNSNIASVDQTGKVTAVKAGSAKITVTTEDGGKAASCAVTVTTVAVEGVTIASSEDQNLKVGLNLDVTAMVSPANATDQTVTWSDYDTDGQVGSIKDSDDNAKEIASYTMLEGTITVTGVAVGAGILTVTTTDGNHSDTLKITVVAGTTNGDVTRVTISPSEDQNLEVESTLKVTATVSPADATDKTVTWSDYDTDATPPVGSIKASDDNTKEIATYTIGEDEKLTVIGVALGSGTLTVTTTNETSATLNITVVAASTVTISLPDGVTSATLTAADATLQLSANADPMVDGATFIWSSGNPAVATVEQATGVVTAVSHGTATITADYNDGNKETIDIIVDIAATNCDFETVISPEQYANAPSDELMINSLAINGNCLKINFSTGGCRGETWELKLIDSGDILESLPPQRNLRLSLKNEELCKAYITKELTFDITNLQVEGNQVQLNITNSDENILYEY